MPDYQVDRFKPATGYRGQDLVRNLDVFSGASSVTVDDGGTYTLYSGDGTAVATASTSSGTATITVPSDLAVGSKSYETWAVTLDSGTTTTVIQRPFLCTAASIIESPITNQAVIASHNGWSTYPAGRTSWDIEIREAWYEILWWLTGRTRMAAQATLANTDTLYRAALMATRMKVARYLASFGEESSMRWHAFYEKRFYDELASLVSRFDTTGDGVADTGYVRVGTDAPGFPGPGPTFGGFP